MTHTHSLVILVPAAHKATVEAAGQALGHSGNEYGVPLSPTGAEPATHWACHAWATRHGVLLFMGTLPHDEEATADEIAEVTARLSVFTPEEVAFLRGVLIMSASTEITGSEHFDAILAANGLQRVEAEGVGI